MTLILVIDDEALVRDTIRLALQRSGYEIDEAADGEEGVRKFREKLPELVITDIIMPNKEGIETITEIRSISPGARVIAISGGGRIGDMRVLDYAKKLGADRVLEKPLREKTLLSAVSEMLA